MLFTDLLSLHLVTFLMFFVLVQDLGILPTYKELSSLTAVSVLHVYHVVMTIASSKS